MPQTERLTLRNWAETDTDSLYEYAKDPAATCESPYDGAKEMLLVDEVDNKEFLTGLFHAIYDELLYPKRKTRDDRVPIRQ